MLTLRPAQRIIMASAFSTDNLLASLDAAKEGIEVLQKPFGLEELVGIVESRKTRVAGFAAEPQEARKS
jgi:hypothetical protein